MTDVMFGKEYIVKVTDDGECITVGEMIHCKECFYYQTGNYGKGEWCWCMVHHGYTKDQNYCSWAER